MFKTLKLEDHADALNITDEIAFDKSSDIKGLISLKIPENCLIFKWFSYNQFSMLFAR